MTVIQPSAAPQFSAPGVYVTEQLIGATQQNFTTSPSTAGFVGEHWRGPVNVPILCTSWRDFLNYFGGFQANTSAAQLTNPYLPFAVYEFFQNGGSQAWVYRWQASASTPQGRAATTTLGDSSGATTPPPALRLTAGILGLTNSVGTWANSQPPLGASQPGLYAQVTNPIISSTTDKGAPLGTFNLLIYYGGTAPSNVVEQWNSLSMDPNSVRYAPNVLNSTLSGSLWVYAQDISTSAFPANTPQATVSPVTFSLGADPQSPSQADKQNAFVYGANSTNPNALPGCFDSIPGVLNINVPGETDTTVLSQLINYCTPTTPGRAYSFCVLDPPKGASSGTVNSYMNTLQTQSASSFAALYYPWVNAVDPSGHSFQATRILPPGGFVLGQYASTDSVNGPWYAPAGLPTALNGAVGLEQTISTQNEGVLNLNNVNCLKVVPNSGAVVIFGARTVQMQWAVLYIPIRRTLNYIESRLGEILAFAVFQPNNQMLWTSITAACDTFLTGLAGRNAFQGSTPAQQFYVTCNATNNTPTSISQGIVNTDVGVALNYPAEFVQLTVTQFQSTGVTTVTTTV